ncbi:FAD-dependent oxidoreductase [Acidicapsa dinghuensis]|uniref:FAD-dependent oxidoreductase n=1 Tax=Acidicapsa dinghuensis TaxID=2218256 RepID=A0ABW1EMR6_9BACT|nr:FAD-dependent oxidoreductase [Acidicapsa dinghuensis]
MTTTVLETGCCIAGGGPAGIMLGYLLARQGVEVTVLEKHQDFFRDFRGDTVHPSTLEVLGELGLLEDFLQLPHQTVESVGVVVGNSRLEVADFRHVPTRCKFVALMPQWDFLNFLTAHANRFPTFRLLMQHEVIDLSTKGRRINGVIARNAGRQVEIHADLVVGCDGRHSITRRAARLEVIEHGVPIDVLWFRISRHPGDPAEVLGNVNYGKALILINRSDYFQAGLIIPKGSFDQIKAEGIDAFRSTILQIVPWLHDRVGELQDWDHVKILTVQINRLRRWHRPGMLCIGDAAHAMSPAGGVGINLAIQDSIAAANLLTQPLLQRRVRNHHLAAVQSRRLFPTWMTQSVQLAAHRGLARIFETTGPVHAPWQLKAVTHIPGIHRVLGYAVGMGVRPERILEPKQPKHRRTLIAGCICAGIGVAAGVAVCGWATWKICSATQKKVRTHLRYGWSS